VRVQGHAIVQWLSPTPPALNRFFIHTVLQCAFSDVSTDIMPANSSEFANDLDHADGKGDRPGNDASVLLAAKAMSLISMFQARHME
jgi:hypothetical protein